MTERAEPAECLRALADHLDADLARELRALLADDSHAQTCRELKVRAQRAEDVLAEIRRQFEPLCRNLDRVQEENRELRRRLGIDPWTPVLPAHPTPLPVPGRQS